MSRSIRTRIGALIGGCIVATITVAGSAPVIAGAPSAGVGHGAGARSPIPTDFVQLVDDTGVLSIAVPPTWTDIDTAPGTNDDTTLMPWISASTDYGAYVGTFDVPGAVFIGVTYTTDLQSWIDRLGQAEACGSSSSDAYDDGAFQGVATTFEQCGTSGQATFMVVAANVGDDTTRSYVLQLQAPTAADVAFIEPVLASFNAVGITNTIGADDVVEAPVSEIPAQTTPVVGVTLPDGTPLVPATAPGQGGGAPAPEDTTASDVFTPTNSVAEGAVQIVDDTQTIAVAVPPDWVATATAPAPNASGTTFPQILASPDLAGFASGFTAPGVQFVASPFTADTEAAVVAAAGGLACTAGTAEAYQDPVFSGHILELTACGGTATRIYLVAANPADQSMTASLLVQITEPDDSDLQTILSSFNTA